MRIGMVGLGRMGANMTRRLAGGGISVTAFDVNAAARAALAGTAGVETCDSLAAMVGALEHPRVVWLMLPAGEISQHTLDQLGGLLQAGDLVVDGANAWYKDSIRHASELAAHGIAFVDAGVSGGIWGLENGYALMLGGEPDAFARVLPLVKILAPGPDRGWLHCGPAGSGHFVKMVHNGIEYGMMQSYAEGLALLQAKKEFGIDVAAVSEMWRHGSVVRSWLLDLTAEALKSGTDLSHIKPIIADSGEGRWTAIEAIEQGIPAPVMSLALMMRFASQGSNDYAARLVALMRAGFGGHAVQRDQPAAAGDAPKGSH
ncbi:MAG: phosphogluconate dehydrogenase (NAD(+)-dependent, decarboxylating) [Betaproteobacteria bacterium]